LPLRFGRRSGSKPETAMNTHRPREYAGEPREGLPHPTPRAPKAHAPSHDLLVMSLGPDAEPNARSNHACLNSFVSSSWIIPSGGRPKTIVGL
jgi:hypothetical protein